MKLMTEDNGNPSSVRVIALICTLSGCGVAFLGVWKGLDLTSLAVLVGSILVPGIGGKVYQKKAEQNQ